MAELEVQETPQETPKTPQVVDLTAVEEAASKQGWKPDGELGPLEFLEKGSVFRDNLHKEIKELKADAQKSADVMAKFIHSQEVKEHSAQKRATEERLRAAVEVGDVDEVRKLAPALSTPAPKDPKLRFVEEWVKENPWFATEAEMKSDAQGFYQAEVLASGVDDPEIILPKVRKKIERIHQGHFSPPTNPNRDIEPAAEGNGRRTSSRGLKVSDLTPVERKHFDQFVEGGIKPERLLKSIQAARGE